MPLKAPFVQLKSEVLSLPLDHHSCCCITQSRCFPDRKCRANFCRTVVTSSHSLAVVRPANMYILCRCNSRQPLVNSSEKEEKEECYERILKSITWQTIEDKPGISGIWINSKKLFRSGKEGLLGIISTAVILCKQKNKKKNWNFQQSTYLLTYLSRYKY